MCSSGPRASVSPSFPINHQLPGDAPLVPAPPPSKKCFPVWKKSFFRPYKKQQPPQGTSPRVTAASVSPVPPPPRIILGGDLGEQPRRAAQHRAAACPPMFPGGGSPTTKGAFFQPRRPRIWGKIPKMQILKAWGGSGGSFCRRGLTKVQESCPKKAAKPQLWPAGQRPQCGGGHGRKGGGQSIPSPVSRKNPTGKGKEKGGDTGGGADGGSSGTPPGRILCPPRAVFGLVFIQFMRIN